VNTTNENVPVVVISLDFELRWGVQDVYHADFDSYAQNILSVRETIPIVLKMFSERRIHATWATVGALALQGWDEFFSLDIALPNYANECLNVDLEKMAAIDPSGDFYYAPDLVDKIVKTKFQELGSHTFTHAYMLEEGVTIKNVVDQHDLVEEIWLKKYDLRPRSLVFPRNQCGFIEALNATSIEIYRKTPNIWYEQYFRHYSIAQIARLFKILDSILVSKKVASDGISDRPCQIIFVRFDLHQALWNRHLSKIANHIGKLQGNEVLHLWWHPHNLGYDINLCILRLEELLEIVAVRVDFGSLRSLNMGELNDFG
tara:strand:- start:454 stop:1401 length:948 start_codon:yes stop_codon:yes gene_type:complete